MLTVWSVGLFHQGQCTGIGKCLYFENTSGVWG